MFKETLTSGTFTQLGISREDYIEKKLAEGYTETRYGKGVAIFLPQPSVYETTWVRYGWFLTIPNRDEQHRITAGIYALRPKGQGGMGLATKEGVHEFLNEDFLRFIAENQIQLTHRGNTNDLLTFLRSLPQSVQKLGWISGAPRIPEDLFQAI